MSCCCSLWKHVRYECCCDCCVCGAVQFLMHAVGDQLLHVPTPPNRSGERCRELWCTLLFAIGMQEPHTSSTICTQQSWPMNHIYGLV